MSFTPDPFIASLLSELAIAGFYNTTLDIGRKIGEGKNGIALEVAEQEAVVADVIQHNIVQPYDAWRRIMDFRDDDEREVSAEGFLVVLDETGGELSLGSPSYAPFIMQLRLIVESLRLGPPSSDPSPKGGRGGPPPPDPTPRPTMTPNPPRDQSPENGDGNVQPTRGF